MPPRSTPAPARSSETSSPSAYSACRRGRTVLFDFTDDQRGFDDAVSSLLARRMPASRLREVWEAGQDYDSEVWQPLADLGLLGITIPADRGGSDGSYIDLALPLESCGRHALPDPVVETAAILPLVLLRHGDEPARDRWLGPIAAGEVVAGTCLGESDLVAHGARADVVLVARGDELHLVTRGSYEATPVNGTDPSRRLARCRFVLDDLSLLTRDPGAVQLARTVGAVATASVLVGLSQHLLTTTRDYVLQREQFGQPIGAFQALKHRLADVAVATEAARSLAWSASYVLGTGEDASLEASLAKSSANQAAYLAGAAALQLHGGIGFTWEHDLHLWLQRGRVLETAFGSTDHHRQVVGIHAMASSAS
ncbi:hypothetical protein C3E78_14080 [Aeromicrobium chenweiae]|uniref:Acyl-CoA dehydrogenase n=1 Tax=Aeromicrobium chenweiae TaxID=2079793 RepID=A0A2S0WPL2_9ACTN|nr:hypothetical protein C3E78_14080 [Aeromicrobium chenweiae]